MDEIFDLFQYRSMQPGRTPSWNVVSEFSETAWLEPSKLGSDDRIMLPANLRKRLSWGSPTGSLAALAVIGAEGSVTVTPAAQSKDVVAGLERAIASAPAEQRAMLTLSAMASYSKVSLQPDGRLRLSPPALLHLKGEKEDGEIRVWVMAFENQLTLWPDQTWATAVRSGFEDLQRAIADC